MTIILAVAAATIIVCAVTRHHTHAVTKELHAAEQRHIDRVHAQQLDANLKARWQG